MAKNLKWFVIEGPKSDRWSAWSTMSMMDTGYHYKWVRLDSRLYWFNPQSSGRRSKFWPNRSYYHPGPRHRRPKKILIMNPTQIAIMVTTIYSYSTLLAVPKDPLTLEIKPIQPDLGSVLPWPIYSPIRGWLAPCNYLVSCGVANARPCVT